MTARKFTRLGIGRIVATTMGFTQNQVFSLDTNGQKDLTNFE